MAYINETNLKEILRYADERIGKDGETVAEAIGSVLKAYGEGLAIDGKADDFAQGIDEMNYYHVYSAYNKAEMTDEEKEEKIKKLLAAADKKYTFAGRKLVWISSKAKELGVGYILASKLDRESAAECMRCLKEFVTVLQRFGCVR